MLNVVTWKYPSPTGHRHYTAAHVNRFFRQFAGHYRRPYLAICITDDPAGLDPGIEALPNPVTLPNNYRKLWLFSAAAARAIPGRIFLSDIDVDIVGDLTGLLDRDEDFVGWYDPRYPKVRWSTGNYLLTAGARAFVWEEFEELGADAAENLLAAWYPRHRGMRKVGSDMAWLSYRLPAAEARFGPGIYRRRFIDPSATPADAKIIHYSGKKKPWN
ncbi:MAG: hypothetical protein U5P41_07230 [Gammaproteobacteria bacterium]|nr:hypothetical protein [Gammaproteobacteria bacterium]